MAKSLEDRVSRISGQVMGNPVEIMKYGACYALPGVISYACAGLTSSLMKREGISEEIIAPCAIIVKHTSYYLSRMGLYSLVYAEEFLKGEFSWFEKMKHIFISNTKGTAVSTILTTPIHYGIMKLSPDIDAGVAFLSAVIPSGALAAIFTISHDAKNGVLIPTSKKSKNKDS
jgi:hypothetical protein